MRVYFKLREFSFSLFLFFKSLCITSWFCSWGNTWLDFKGKIVSPDLCSMCFWRYYPRDLSGSALVLLFLLKYNMNVYICVSSSCMVHVFIKWHDLYRARLLALTWWLSSLRSNVHVYICPNVRTNVRESGCTYMDGWTRTGWSTSSPYRLRFLYLHKYKSFLNYNKSRRSRFYKCSLLLDNKVLGYWKQCFITIIMLKISI